MDHKTLLENLCSYDLRNPNNVADPDDLDNIRARKEHCYCDNCFYGRDKLAMEIIKLREKG